MKRVKFRFPKNWADMNITAGDVWGWEEDGTFTLLREMGGEERFPPEELSDLGENSDK